MILLLGFPIKDITCAIVCSAEQRSSGYILQLYPQYIVNMFGLGIGLYKLFQLSFYIS